MTLCLTDLSGDVLDRNKSTWVLFTSTFWWACQHLLACSLSGCQQTCSCWVQKGLPDAVGDLALSCI